MFALFLAINTMCASLASAYTAIDDRNLRLAIAAYRSDEITTTTMYGGIEGARSIVFLSTFIHALLVYLMHSGWDVSAVTDMSFMLNEDGSTLSYWTTTSSTYWYSFNEIISAWDVSSVSDMSGLFFSANAFNQNIGAWETSRVKNMRGMFSGASRFNSNIETWDVSRVKTMTYMFRDASIFNSAIGAWDVNKVTDMLSTFSNARSFNDPTIVSWDISSAINFQRMFDGATSFNVDISPWQFNKNLSYIFTYNMFVNSGYNQVLCWDLTPHSTINLFASLDPTSEKCSCSVNEYYNGLSCVACADGTTSFGMTESCVKCTNALCAPTPAPTASHLPTNTFAPTTLKASIDNNNFYEAMRLWYQYEEDAIKQYGHIFGELNLFLRYFFGGG
jgi:surface protein